MISNQRGSSKPAPLWWGPGQLLAVSSLGLQSRSRQQVSARAGQENHRLRNPAPAGLPAAKLIAAINNCPPVRERGLVSRAIAKLAHPAALTSVRVSWLARVGRATRAAGWVKTCDSFESLASFSTRALGLHHRPRRVASCRASRRCSLAKPLVFLFFLFNPLAQLKSILEYARVKRARVRQRACHSAPPNGGRRAKVNDDKQ